VEEEIRPPRYAEIRLVPTTTLTLARMVDGAPWNVFSYWDKPDLTPIQPTLEGWRSHFPDFRIFGDPEIEPLIEKVFPQYLETFRKIRIPTCKSDLALLLALYEFGGLYIDCHCGVRDPHAIRQLLLSLDTWELILYDKSLATEPRPSTQLFALNSVIFARPNSSIILKTLTNAFHNLELHRSAEKERGFQSYNIWTLSGPGVLQEVLLVEQWTDVSEVKPEYAPRVRFIREDGKQPIGRYTYSSYRQPGMHWSERQQNELLFAE